MNPHSIRQIAHSLFALAWWLGATVGVDGGVVFSNSPSSIVVNSQCFFVTDLVVNSISNNTGAFAIRMNFDTNRLQLAQIDVRSDSPFHGNAFVDPAAPTSGVVRVVAFQATNSSYSREDLVLRVLWGAIGNPGQATDIQIVVEKIIDFQWLPVSASAVSATVQILNTNTAPSLGVIGDRTINAGVTLSITNVASDPDAPPQVLTFSLLDAPTNATLSSSSGILAWRPLVTQAGTTNLITVRVSDDALPSLSATQSFLVAVNPLTRPSVSTFSLAGEQPALTVSGDVGPDYAVQASTNLVEWETVFTTQSPVTPFYWTDTNGLAFEMRFYRIVVGPPLP